MKQLARAVRRIFPLLLILLLCASAFAGCGRKRAEEQSAAASQSVSVSQSAAASQGSDDAQSEAEEPGDDAQSTAEESGDDAQSVSGETSGGDAQSTEEQNEGEATDDPVAHTDELREDGTYTAPEAVAAYIHTYGRLPDNFITKKEAQELGWKNGAKYVSDAAPGMSIGGDRFGNYEGLLPDGHDYYECDVNYDGGKRGPERLVYSDDGLIFYSPDHYETFEQLY